MTDKISPEELQSLRDLQNKFSEISKRWGELKFQEIILEQETQQLNREHTSLIASLQDKYGVGTVDIRTGDFTPQK